MMAPSTPDYRSLPFQRWDLAFERDESSHSYFRRLVAHQGGEKSLATFKMFAGMNFQHLVPNEILEALLKVPFPEELKERLTRHTMVLRGSARHLCDEAFSVRRSSVDTLRWCPACLGEAAYGRVWFDLKVIQRCPYHGLTMVDRDSVGGRINWYWMDYTRSPSGVPLGVVGVERRPRTESFAFYLLGRLGLEERRPAPLLDNAEMTAIVQASEMLGRLFAHPYATRTPVLDVDTIDVGFAAISSTEVQLVERLRAFIRLHRPNFKDDVINTFG